MRVDDSTAIPGLRRIEPDVFRDERGEFVETWNDGDYAFEREDGAPLVFREDDLSLSRAGVLRGLHGDRRTWKLVQCAHGALHAVVADLRPESGAYLRWEPFELTAANRLQLLIPPGCATGVVALADPSLMLYKQSERYAGAEGQFTVRWDDPALGIDWPVARPLLSERDAGAPDIQP